jgi:hypothetical protein
VKVTVIFSEAKGKAQRKNIKDEIKRDFNIILKMCTERKRELKSTKKNKPQSDPRQAHSQTKCDRDHTQPTTIRRQNPNKQSMKGK